MLNVEQLETRTLFASFTATSTADLIADINAANSTAAADTITLIAGKVYTLTAVNNTGDGATGLPSITKPLTIIGNGGVIERSSVSSTPAFRLLDVNAGASLTLKNLTLRNGLTLGDTSGGFSSRLKPHGGAIFSQGTLNLDQVTLNNNIARGRNANAYRGRETIVYVPAGIAQGGAIFSSGSLTMTRSIVRNNTAQGGGGYPARLFVHAAVVPGGGYGGGVAIRGGVANISTTTFTANLAVGGFGTPSTGGSGSGRGGSGYGGALSVAAPDASIFPVSPTPTATVALSSCTFTGNTARGGAGGNGSAVTGLYTGGAGGSGFGGAIYARIGSLSLRNVTATTNSAIAGIGGLSTTNVRAASGQGIGGGIYKNSTGPLGLNAFTIANVKLNTATTSNANIFGTYTTIV